MSKLFVDQDRFNDDNEENEEGMKDIIEKKDMVNIRLMSQQND